MGRRTSLIRKASAAVVSAHFDRRKRQVLTFSGYYGAGYEDEAGMLDEARLVLDAHSARGTIVNIGAMPEGIGQVYSIAKEMGFETTGIVSGRAWARRERISPDVDTVFFIDDETWGGFLPGTRTLSPTSQVMVECSDILVAIGGNTVTRDEMVVARRLGKTITFIPADMNHEKAMERARMTGNPPPRQFRGEAHPAFEST